MISLIAYAFPTLQKCQPRRYHTPQPMAAMRLPKGSPRLLTIRDDDLDVPSQSLLQQLAKGKDVRR